MRRLDQRRAIMLLRLGRLDIDEAASMVRACLRASYPVRPGATGEPVGAELAMVAAVARAADGVPFLVEELLASSGVPASFAETITARLGVLSDEQRAVVSAAAVLGRRFDWRLLPRITATSAQGVTAELRAAVHGRRGAAYPISRSVSEVRTCPYRRLRPTALVVSTAGIPPA